MRIEEDPRRVAWERWVSSEKWTGKAVVAPGLVTLAINLDLTLINRTGIDLPRSLPSHLGKLVLASQKHDKQGLGYSSSENASKSLSPSCPSDRLQPSGGYNVVPPLITGNFMPPKPDLVFHTAPIAVETAHSVFIVKLSSSEPTQDLSHTNRPSAPIIEE
nr:hypothetical protein [Tanacetum cinerariifolium]